MLLHSTEISQFKLPHTEEEVIIIVGAGPVGMRLLEELDNNRCKKTIIMYGDEPWFPYDRVKLSSLLAGKISFNNLYQNFPFEFRPNIQFRNRRITSINPDDQCVEDEQGEVQHFDKLVLAIGSTASIPNIAGTQLKGVYTFRDLSDTERLLARLTRTRTTVVIGGGLLGLESARAMQRRNTRIHLIEHATSLMSRQLPEDVAYLLQQTVVNLGITVHTGRSVKQIVGEDSVDTVVLDNGVTIHCDTVIIAAGIRPNIDLARNSGIVVGRGVKVDEQLQTSRENIFAIGDCCEFNQKVYGLVGPGMEQALVLSNRLLGGDKKYQGSTSATSLKVIERSIYSAGIEAPDINTITDNVISYRDPDNETLHHLVLRHRRIVGAYGMGPWPEFNTIKHAIETRSYIGPLKQWRFTRSGSIWPAETEVDVKSWSDNATICSCRGINKAKICASIKNEKTTIYDIKNSTGASTVCGSCEPLISGLLGKATKIMPQFAYKPLFHFSAASLIFVVLFGLLEPLAYSSSMSGLQIDTLWRNGLYKQISGFTLIGLVILGLSLFSIRKRFNIKRMGHVGGWRLVHTVFATSSLLTLSIHTGLHMGNNLNAALMFSFLLASITGVVLAMLTAYEHALKPLRAKQYRRTAFWGHLLSVWPLPLLLGFHITTVYYF